MSSAFNLRVSNSRSWGPLLPLPSQQTTKSQQQGSDSIVLTSSVNPLMTTRLILLPRSTEPSLEFGFTIYETQNLKWNQTTVQVIERTPFVLHSLKKSKSEILLYIHRHHDNIVHFHRKRYAEKTFTNTSMLSSQSNINSKSPNKRVFAAVGFQHHGVRSHCDASSSVFQSLSRC